MRRVTESTGPCNMPLAQLVDLWPDVELVPEENEVRMAPSLFATDLTMRAVRGTHSHHFTLCTLCLCIGAVHVSV